MIRVCMLNVYTSRRLRCSLAMGLKQLGQAARVAQRAVHGVEQRQIAELVLTPEYPYLRTFLGY